IVGAPPGQDPRETGERLVAVEKSNLGVYPAAFSFELAPAPGDPSRAVVIWGGEVEGIRAGDLVGEPGPPGDDPVDAAEVILELLDDRPMKAPDLERAVSEAAISRDPFKAARARLRAAGRIVRRRESSGHGQARAWWWELAEPTGREADPSSWARPVGKPFG